VPHTRPTVQHLGSVATNTRETTAMAISTAVKHTEQLKIAMLY